MTVTAGELTSRILLQRESQSSNTDGSLVSSWTTVASPWARVEQTAGGEPTQTWPDPSRRRFNVTVRRRSDLTSSLRVCWGAVVMNVVSVRQDDTDREFSVLECVEEPRAAR